MSSGRWSVQEIPSQAGRVAVITGANSGIGYDTALELARAGAEVVLACRSVERGEAALSSLKEAIPEAKAAMMPLDLADLDQVAQFANDLRERFDRVDLLINNAGVMMVPKGETVQGFETQFGVNHLGHFALTGHLLGLMSLEGARVVNVSSVAHRRGRIDLDDLNWESRPYNKVAAYGQSKLANLLFTLELQRRLDSAGARVMAVSAHPGWSNTNLASHLGPMNFITKLIAQPSHRGALPTLRAAVDPEARGGDYYGPNGFKEFSGDPVKVQAKPHARNGDHARRLFDLSEEMTGVQFSL